jgi:hypothetical protein
VAATSGRSRILEPADLEAKDTHVNVTQDSASSAGHAANAMGAARAAGSRMEGFRHNPIPV